MRSGRLFTSILKVLISTLFLSQAIVACKSENTSIRADEDVDKTVPSEDVSNTVPVAQAGDDQTVIPSTTVLLDAQSSFDNDGDTLSYQWSITSLPENSTATLDNSESLSTSFIADVAGDYVIALVVNDGITDSVVDTVTIHSTVSAEVPSETYKSYAIVDTNQTNCYDSTTGDSTSCAGDGFDGDYAGTQPSYTLSADGLTVSDNITNLVWTQSSDLNNDGVVNYDDKLFQSEAVSYCEDLTVADRDDWRLPNLKEAYSLILFSGKDPSNYQGTDTSTLTLFLDDVFDRAFGDLDSDNDRIIDGQYASTTLYVSTTMNGNETMLGVNYVDGRIKGYPISNKEYYVRCVAGNTEYGINDFADNSDETISDLATGLMWQQNDDVSINWEDAISQCETSTTAGYSDWRLPNVKELQSIVDYNRSPDTDSSAAISPLFNSTSFQNEEGITDWGYYWASTTHVDNSDNGSNATYLSFGRALGYMNGSIMDVHGAGSQRSNDKLSVANEPGATSATGSTGTFYYKGPQGDILRDNNYVRCVRDIPVSSSATEASAYTLFAPMGSTDTYLIDESGNTVHTWQSNYRPGLSVYLLENGELLRTGAKNVKPTTFEGQFGGAAGIIEILDWDSNIVWSTTLATESYFSHHDVKQLPNGNILSIVWEAKTAQEATELGRTTLTDETLWAGAIYEVCRASSQNSCVDGEIVWQWSTWDHIIQDTNSEITSTYVDDIAQSPNKVNINYVSGNGGSDWTHFNSIDYNEVTKQILISVRSFSEYWVIDYTSPESGIIARIGNPQAYDSVGEQRLFSQHDAQWINNESTGESSISVFNNGVNRPEGDYSSVDEFCYSSSSCTSGELVSSYSQGVSGDFYADHISGAQRLENGNTLVCEGTEGRLFEYDSSHNMVWEFIYGGEIFKASRYLSDYTGLTSLNNTSD